MIKFEAKSSHAIVIDKSFTTTDIYFINESDYELFKKQALEHGLIKVKGNQSNYYIIPNEKHEEGVIEKEMMDAYKDAKYYLILEGKNDNGWYSCSVNEPT